MFAINYKIVTTTIWATVTTMILFMDLSLKKKQKKPCQVVLMNIKVRWCGSQGVLEDNTMYEAWELTCWTFYINSKSKFQL